MYYALGKSLICAQAYAGEKSVDKERKVSGSREGKGRVLIHVRQGKREMKNRKEIGEAKMKGSTGVIESV